jgi:hypothetical protein
MPKRSDEATRNSGERTRKRPPSCETATNAQSAASTPQERTGESAKDATHTENTQKSGKVRCANTGLCDRWIDPNEASWYMGDPFCGKCY